MRESIYQSFAYSICICACRIRYVHLMAHFRMFRQIREQSAATIRGFKAVVQSDWLALFSAPELQKLVSGDASALDIEDLRWPLVFSFQSFRFLILLTNIQV